MSANATTARSGLPPFFRRRRFWRTAIPVASMVLAFLAGLVLYDSLYGNNGIQGRIPLPKQPPTPKTVKFSSAEAKDVHGLITEFVKTAVARKDLAKSYSLIGPGLREGIPLRKWSTGYMTVVPYPVDRKTTVLFEKPDWSYATSARIQVHVITPDRPKQTAQQVTDTFFVYLIKRHGHWLVDNWVPRWTPPIPNGL